MIAHVSLFTVFKCLFILTYSLVCSHSHNYQQHGDLFAFAFMLPFLESNSIFIYHQSLSFKLGKL